MRRMLSRFSALAVLALLVPGCGGGTSTVAGEVVTGSEKMDSGDKIVITLSNDKGSGASGEADASGKFSIPNVPAGTYKVKVIHYTSGGTSTKAFSQGTKGSISQNTTRDYPEEWTVPGGPFKIELSKLKK